MAAFPQIHTPSVHTIVGVLRQDALVYSIAVVPPINDQTSTLTLPAQAVDAAIREYAEFFGLAMASPTVLQWAQMRIEWQPLERTAGARGARSYTQNVTFCAPSADGLRTAFAHVYEVMQTKGRG